MNGLSGRLKFHNQGNSNCRPSLPNLTRSHSFRTFAAFKKSWSLEKSTNWAGGNPNRRSLSFVSYGPSGNWVRCGPRIGSTPHITGALGPIHLRVCDPEFKNNSSSLLISLRRNSFANFERNIPAIFLMVRSGPCDVESRSGERKWRNASSSVQAPSVLRLPASGINTNLEMGLCPMPRDFTLSCQNAFGADRLPRHSGDQVSAQVPSPECLILCLASNRIPGCCAGTFTLR